MKNGFYIISMIKQINSEYPKMELQEKLENGERGEHAVSTSSIYGERVIAVV